MLKIEIVGVFFLIMWNLNNLLNVNRIFFEEEEHSKNFKNSCQDFIFLFSWFLKNLGSYFIFIFLNKVLAKKKKHLLSLSSAITKKRQIDKGSLTVVIFFFNFKNGKQIGRWTIKKETDRWTDRQTNMQIRDLSHVPCDTLLQLFVDFSKQEIIQLTFCC